MTRSGCRREAGLSGIGQIIMDSRFALQTDKMIVGLLVLGILGAFLQAGFDAMIAGTGAFRRLR